MAKAYASDACRETGNRAVQVQGGMGFTWAFDCHLFYRRAKLLGLALGSSREWKHRLITELRSRNTNALAA